MAANLEKVQSISRIAGADYTGDNPGQYRFGVVGSDGKVDLCGAGARAHGVILGKADADQAIEFAFGGRVLVVLGGTVAAGANLQSDANGAAVTQSSTNVVNGTALEAGVAGDIISMIFDPQGAP